MCHCIECQKRTGSVFGVSAWFREEQVEIEGPSTTFVRTGDEGGRIEHHFCPTCGSTVYYKADYRVGSVGVPVGGFGDSTFPAPTVSIYEHRRHPWVEIPSSIVERD
jgi:hypothetical protein